jgi:hypothetical protein
MKIDIAKPNFFFLKITLENFVFAPYILFSLKFTLR